MELDLGTVQAGRVVHIEARMEASDEWREAKLNHILLEAADESDTSETKLEAAADESGKAETKPQGKPAAAVVAASAAAAAAGSSRGGDTAGGVPGRLTADSRSADLLRVLVVAGWWDPRRSALRSPVNWDELRELVPKPPATDLVHKSLVSPRVTDV